MLQGVRHGATEPLEHTRLQSSRRMRRERSERSVRTQITSFSRLLPNQAIHHCSPTQGDAASPLRQARQPQAPTEICRLYSRCFIKQENQSQDTPSQCDGMSWLKPNTSSDLFAIIFLHKQIYRIVSKADILRYFICKPDMQL